MLKNKLFNSLKATAAIIFCMLITLPYTLSMIRASAAGSSAYDYNNVQVVTGSNGALYPQFMTVINTDTNVIAQEIRGRYNTVGAVSIVCFALGGVAILSLAALIIYDIKRKGGKHIALHCAALGAVANAIAHADYGANNPIQISIYDDRVEIANDGRLPKDWTVNTLYQKHRSRPHNPFIASVFFRAGIIEAWGRGVERINAAMRTAGKSDIKYECSGSDFTAILETADHGITHGINISLDIIKENVLQIIKNKPTATVSEIAVKMGKSKASADNAVRALKKKGAIKRVGSKKSSYWEVIA